MTVYSLNRAIDICIIELCRMFVVLGTSLLSSFGSYEDILQDKHFNTKERVLKENIIRNSLLSFSEKSCILEVLCEIKDCHFSTQLLRAVPVEATKACKTDWTWNFRKLWPTKWVLETELGSSARTTGALNSWANSLASCKSFNLFFWLFSNSSDIVLVDTPLLLSFFPPLALMTITTAMFPSAFPYPNHCTSPVCLPWS